MAPLFLKTVSNILFKLKKKYTLILIINNKNNMNNVNWGVKFFKKAMFYVKVMTKMSLFETLY